MPSSEEERKSYKHRPERKVFETDVTTVNVIDPSQPSFIQLPPEIRNLVYRSYFENDIFACKYIRGCDIGGWCRKVPKPHPRLAILRICKGLYHDIFDAWFEFATFFLDDVYCDIPPIKILQRMKKLRGTVELLDILCDYPKINYIKRWQNTKYYDDPLQYPRDQIVSLEQLTIVMTIPASEIRYPFPWSYLYTYDDAFENLDLTLKKVLQWQANFNFTLHIRVYDDSDRNVDGCESDSDTWYDYGDRPWRFAVNSKFQITLRVEPPTPDDGKTFQEALEWLVLGEDNSGDH